MRKTPGGDTLETGTGLDRVAEASVDHGQHGPVLRHPHAPARGDPFLRTIAGLDVPAGDIK